ncbi:MAG: class II fructose-bisphosphate aldolase [Firmicutes bacterium]|nr:class II fructose-bisphosphate aldolase [Bacillota bacterium]
MNAHPRELVTAAWREQQLLPALNIDSWDMAQGVLAAAEALTAPILVQVTAETLDIWGWGPFTRALRELIAAVPVPVGLVLDHAKSRELVARALDAGFLGVMFDGSALPLAANIAETAQVVAAAAPYRAWVEGEVGHVARDGEPPEWESLTTVEEAITFVTETGVDALAVAVGSKHGHYRSAADIRLDRVREISAAVARPLVLHGGSGVPTALMGALKASGIVKMNIGTELRRAWWEGLHAGEAGKPREALQAARVRVTARAETLIARMRAQEPGLDAAGTGEA